MINKFKKKDKQKGALLFELLIVISLLAIILSFGANAMFLSMKSNKISGEKDTASALASEELESVRSVVEEDWQNIYSLTKSTGHYYTTQSIGKWIVSSGDETVNINNISFIRYFIIENVSRDGTTRNIQNTYSSTNDDPSTQKITVFVTWIGGNTFSVSEYFFRWKNKICGQTDWATGGSGSTVKNCTDASYDVKDTGVDVSGGSIKLQ